jgi:hypothetical protein
MTLKVQNDVKEGGGYWWRCSRADLDGEMVRWELNPESRYSFFEAYPRKPHLQFIEAKDDAKLRNFARAWGPLYFSTPWESAWSNSHPIEHYRRERDELIAVIQVLGAVEENKRQRSALTRWIEMQHRIGNDDVTLAPLRKAIELPGNQLAGFDADFRNWLGVATSKQIESAILAVVPQITVGFLSPNRFSVERVGRRSVVRAELGLGSLKEALYWMVWQDFFQKRPYQFCKECGAVFGMRNGHERKFCPGPCAHNYAARESYRRKHPTSGEENRQNGTHKTR